MLAIIVAVSENGVIGREKGLPWTLPDDFAFFKQQTMGFPIVMGRKTFESLPKILPGRTHYIISSTLPHKEEYILCQSLEQALAKANEENHTVFVIGGSKVFEAALDVADTIFLTRIHAVVEGDVYFPTLRKEDWYVESSSFHPTDKKHEYAFTFHTLKRVRI